MMHELLVPTIICPLYKKMPTVFQFSYCSTHLFITGGGSAGIYQQERSLDQTTALGPQILCNRDISNCPPFTVRHVDFRLSLVFFSCRQPKEAREQLKSSL